MINLQTIDNLIESVEAGQIRHDADMKYLGGYSQNRLGLNAYRGSLDAAKALHEELLPGWMFGVTNDGAFVMPAGGDDTSQFTGALENPARAWLAAMLKAYRAQLTTARPDQRE